MKSELSLYTGNHHPYGISDQLTTLERILKNDIHTNITQDIPNTKNVLLIENFTDFQVRKFIKMKEKKCSSLFVLLTEHMWTDHFDTLHLNGNLWNSDFEYIPNIYNRFLNLVKLYPIIDAFVTLYGYPEINRIKTIFPSIPILDLSDFRKLNQIMRQSVVSKSHFDYDFCFFGMLTEHRNYLLKILSSKFRVYSDTGVSDHERALILEKSMFCLSLPQNSSWSNVSPMRIINAASSGKYTVNIDDTGLMSNFPYSANVPLGKIMALDSFECLKFVEPDRELMECEKFQVQNFLRWLD